MQWFMSYFGHRETYQMSFQLLQSTVADCHPYQKILCLEDSSRNLANISHEILPKKNGLGQAKN